MAVMGHHASATITDSPDEVPMTENPQAIGGETSMEEDAGNQGRPQWVRQAPKRLTYMTVLGTQLTYGRLMKDHLPR